MRYSVDKLHHVKIVKTLTTYFIGKRPYMYVHSKIDILDGSKRIDKVELRTTIKF